MASTPHTYRQSQYRVQDQFCHPISCVTLRTEIILPPPQISTSYHPGPIRCSLTRLLLLSCGHCSKPSQPLSISEALHGVMRQRSTETSNALPEVPQLEGGRARQDADETVRSKATLQSLLHCRSLGDTEHPLRGQTNESLPPLLKSWPCLIFTKSFRRRCQTTLNKKCKDYIKCQRFCFPRLLLPIGVRGDLCGCGGLQGFNNGKNKTTNQKT